MNQIYDVIIIGLGALGSASFYQASKEGLKVLGIDQFIPPYSFGSSHGQTRITRNAIGEGDFYTPLVLRANHIRQEIERACNTKLFYNCGVFIVGKESYSFVQETIKSAKNHNIEIDILTKNEAIKKFPQFCLEDGEIGIFEKGGGYLLAEKSVEYQLKLGQSLGGELALNQKITEIDYTQNPIKISTANNAFFAKKLVITAGKWVGELIKEKNIFRSIPQKVFWLKADKGRFCPELFPAFIRAKENENNDLYGFPSLDGESIKIAMENFDESKNDFENDLFEFKQFIPELRGEVVQTSDCTYVVSPDSHFVVDCLDQNQNVIIATGAGHGFKYSYSLGEAILSLIHGTKDPVLEHFSLSRFG